MPVVRRSATISSVALERPCIADEVSKMSSQRLAVAESAKASVGSSRLISASRVTSRQPRAAVNAISLLYSSFFILRPLMPPVEFVSFTPIVMFNLILQFRQCILHGLNKIPTTGCHAAEVDDRIALGRIIGYSKNFAVGLEAYRGALNHLIGSLPGPGEEDFHVGS